MKRIAFAAVTTILAACSTTPPVQDDQSGSELQSVTLQLPKKDGLAASGVSPDVVAKLTDYRFTLTALPQPGAKSIAANCQVKGDGIMLGGYSDSAVIALKLQKACLYDAKLEIGQNSAAVKAFTTYYLGDSQVDTSKAVNGKLAISIQLAWNSQMPVTGGGVPPVIIAGSSDIDVSVTAKFPGATGTATGSATGTATSSATSTATATATASATATATATATTAAVTSYLADVKPILDQACAKCHGANATEPDLSSYTAVKTSIADAIGDATSGRMPPGSGNPKLTADQIAKLNKWQTDGLQP